MSSSNPNSFVGDGCSKNASNNEKEEEEVIYIDHDDDDDDDDAEKEKEKAADAGASSSGGGDSKQQGGVVVDGLPPPDNHTTKENSINKNKDKADESNSKNGGTRGGDRGNGGGGCDNNDGDDEIVLIRETGPRALADFPHPRENCAVYPYDPNNKRSCSLFCDNCYCYVCDIKASECQNKHLQQTGQQIWRLFHCFATSKNPYYKELREKEKRKNKRRQQQQKPLNVVTTTKRSRSATFASSSPVLVPTNSTPAAIKAHYSTHNRRPAVGAQPPTTHRSITSSTSSYGEEGGASSSWISSSNANYATQNNGLQWGPNPGNYHPPISGGAPYHDGGGDFGQFGCGTTCQNNALSSSSPNCGGAQPPSQQQQQQQAISFPTTTTSTRPFFSGGNHGVSSFYNGSGAGPSASPFAPPTSAAAAASATSRHPFLSGGNHSMSSLNNGSGAGPPSVASFAPSTSVASAAKKKGADLPPILQDAKAKQLIEIIKNLACNWAQEERMVGNGAVFYRDILSDDTIKMVASQAPMTTDDLNDLLILMGDNNAYINEYSRRLVKAISNFVIQNDLLELVQTRTAANRLKKPILPAAKAQELTEIIKKLASNWAEEERMLGNKVFYWHILSADAMEIVAVQAPMTMDELHDLGILGENFIKEYGGRLVKVISNFVVQNKLEDLVRRKKRLKVDSSSASTITNSRTNNKKAGAGGAA